MSNVNIFTLAQQKMNFLTARQKIISENIVQAQMPGYLPRDLKSFGEVVKQQTSQNLQAKLTHPSHKKSLATPSLSISLVEQVVVNDQELSPSGNGVVLDKEMMKSGEIGMKFKEVAAIIDRYNGLRRKALMK